MKIFLDTAHIPTIEKWAKTGIINGVTTNPTHLSKEGGDPKEIVREICKLLPQGDISVEVTEREPQAVYAQAMRIAEISDNVLVKVPCHVDYYAVIKKLVEQQIRLNITLVFSLVQSMMMCKLEVEYISPFIGRLDDIGVHGIHQLQQICTMVKMREFYTQVLAASIRSPEHFHDAMMAGADAITLPVDVLEKSVGHPLTDKGIDLFLADWQKLGIRQFP